MICSQSIKSFSGSSHSCRPILRVPGERENGHTDRLLPIAFEFAMMLTDAPEVDRVGPVFEHEGRVGLLQANEAPRMWERQVTVSLPAGLRRPLTRGVNPSGGR